MIERTKELTKNKPLVMSYFRKTVGFFGLTEVFILNMKDKNNLKKNMTNIQT